MIELPPPICEIPLIMRSKLMKILLTREVIKPDKRAMLKIKPISDYQGLPIIDLQEINDTMKSMPSVLYQKYWIDTVTLRVSPDMDITSVMASMPVVNECAATSLEKIDDIPAPVKKRTIGEEISRGCYMGMYKFNWSYEKILAALSYEDRDRVFSWNSLGMVADLLKYHLQRSGINIQEVTFFDMFLSTEIQGFIYKDRHYNLWDPACNFPFPEGFIETIRIETETSLMQAHVNRLREVCWNNYWITPYPHDDDNTSYRQ